MTIGMAFPTFKHTYVLAYKTLSIVKPTCPSGTPCTCPEEKAKMWMSLGLPLQKQSLPSALVKKETGFEAY